MIEKYCAMRSNGFYVDVASIMYNKEFMEIQEIKFNYIKTLPKEKLNDFKDMLVLEGMNYFDSNIKPYLISLNYDESAVNLEYLAFSEKYADFCMLKEVKVGRKGQVTIFIIVAIVIVLVIIGILIAVYYPRN